jgi:polyisoprenoid-binding protein YceI
VRGNFTEFSGVVDFDEKKSAPTKVSFVAKADSISTNNAKRDGHLKSPDFFDTAKFPEARFVSTGIKSKGKDKFAVEGDLTIHGITKKAVFDFASLGKVKDAYGVEKRMFQATTDIVRKDYGIVYNAPLETGGLMIGETAKVTVDLETAAKKPAAK